MRSLLLFVVALAACDLHPPPKKKPAPATPQPADTPPPPEPGSAAEPAPPVFETSAACNEVGVKVAGALIDSAQDPTQKATLTQERDRIVRRVAEACTRDNWPPASRECFLKAKTQEEMQICGQGLAAPREE